MVSEWYSNGMSLHNVLSVLSLFYVIIKANSVVLSLLHALMNLIKTIKTLRKGTISVCDLPLISCLCPNLLQLSAAVSASGELKIISEQDTDAEAPSLK